MTRRLLCGWLLPALLFSSCVALVTSEDDEVPDRIIFLIGDGMGPQQVGLLLDWAAAAGEAPTALERITNNGSLGVLRTAPLGMLVTDSAASGTALACGVSTVNGRIAMDAEGKSLPTCLEAARDSHWRTGLVTTTSVTHATPACFAAHVPQRAQQSEIARQYLEESGVDVFLGGGRAFFLAPPGGEPKLESTIEERGYRLVQTPGELAALPAETPRVLGLFANSHLPYLLDREVQRADIRESGSYFQN